METGRMMEEWTRGPYMTQGTPERVIELERRRIWKRMVEENTYMTQGTPDTGARRISGDGSTNPATNCGRGDISTVNT